MPSSSPRPRSSQLGSRAVFRSARRALSTAAPRILAYLAGWAGTWVLIEGLVVAIGSGPGRPIWLALHVAYFWATAYWEAAICRFALDAIRGTKPDTLHRALSEHGRALRVFALKMMLLPSILLGMTLLVVPGLAVAARFGLSVFFVVDRSQGPLEALAASRRTTRGHTRALVFVAFVVVLLNLAGAALLGLGLLLTVPLTALAGAQVFHSLTQGASE